MKKFNLEKALAGEPVVTRNGKKVTDLKLFNTQKFFKLFGVIDDDLESFNIEGHCLFKEGHEHDLFMANGTKSIWVNVYKKQNGEIFLGSLLTSEEDARSAESTKGYSKIKTIEITY